MVEILRQVFVLKVIEGEKQVILDAPTLFETKVLEYMCYPIVIVFIDDDQVQIDRLMKRNSLTREQAVKRIDSQMPMKIKLSKSEIHVDN